MRKFILLLIALLCTRHIQTAKILRFRARAQHKSTPQQDYINAYNMIHHSNSKWNKEIQNKHFQGIIEPVKHEGIYALTLS